MWLQLIAVTFIESDSDSTYFPSLYSVSCQSYRMNSSPRGFALVISNVNFDPHALPKLDRRNGGEVDEEVLRKVFTELDYLTTVRRDLPAQVSQEVVKTTTTQLPQDLFDRHG